jgi:hypothetical protein
VARKDLFTRLADAGEDALTKLGDAPGMERMTGFANTTRERLDELTRRVRGIDALEQRVSALEKRLDEMSGTTKSTPAKKKTTTSSSSGKTSSSKSSTAKTGGSSPG